MRPGEASPRQIDRTPTDQSARSHPRNGRTPAARSIAERMRPGEASPRQIDRTPTDQSARSHPRNGRTPAARSIAERMRPGGASPRQIDRTPTDQSAQSHHGTVALGSTEYRRPDAPRRSVAPTDRPHSDRPIGTVAPTERSHSGSTEYRRPGCAPAERTCGADKLAPPDLHYF